MGRMKTGRFDRFDRVGLRVGLGLRFYCRSETKTWDMFPVWIVLERWWVLLEI